jgi:hypothetical protein
VSQDIDLDSWADSLRAWPNPPEGWVAWYNRVARVHQSTWEAIGIADALSLSLSPLEKNENLLKTIGYFWSDALNCFSFGHSLMTPTLMDVVMITFRLDNFVADDSTRHLYSIMIHPCFLPLGMSTSNRIIKPSYESYQPVVAARQFGLG